MRAGLSKFHQGRHPIVVEPFHCLSISSQDRFDFAGRTVAHRDHDEFWRRAVNDRQLTKVVVLGHDGETMRGGKGPDRAVIRARQA